MLIFFYSIPILNKKNFIKKEHYMHIIQKTLLIALTTLQLTSNCDTKRDAEERKLHALEQQSKGLLAALEKQSAELRKKAAQSAHVIDVATEKITKPKKQPVVLTEAEKNADTLMIASITIFTDDKIKPTEKAKNLSEILKKTANNSISFQGVAQIESNIATFIENSSEKDQAAIKKTLKDQLDTLKLKINLDDLLNYIEKLLQTDDALIQKSQKMFRNLFDLFYNIALQYTKAKITIPMSKNDFNTLDKRFDALTDTFSDKVTSGTISKADQQEHSTWLGELTKQEDDFMFKSTPKFKN